MCPKPIKPERPHPGEPQWLEIMDCCENRDFHNTIRQQLINPFWRITLDFHINQLFDAGFSRDEVVTYEVLNEIAYRFNKLVRSENLLVRAYEEYVDNRMRKEV